MTASRNRPVLPNGGNREIGVHVDIAYALAAISILEKFAEILSKDISFDIAIANHGHAGKTALGDGTFQIREACAESCVVFNPDEITDSRRFDRRDDRVNRLARQRSLFRFFSASAAAFRSSGSMFSAVAYEGSPSIIPTSFSISLKRLKSLMRPPLHFDRGSSETITTIITAMRIIMTGDPFSLLSWKDD